MSIDNSGAGASGIVAGWYADPADSTQMRYWDGAGWTDRTAPLTATPAAPVAPAAPVVAAPVVAAPVVAAPAVAAPVVAAPAPSPFDDVTSAMAPAPAVATAAPSDFGGGFVAPTAATVAATTVAPSYAPSAAVASAPTLAPAIAAPVVVAAGHPTDEQLARSARRVATVFDIISLVVLVLGIAGGVLLAVLGFMASGTESEDAVGGLAALTAAGPLGGILAGVIVVLYSIVLWAFWKLLAIVARYIALKSE